VSQASRYREAGKRELRKSGLSVGPRTAGLKCCGFLWPGSGDSRQVEQDHLGIGLGIEGEAILVLDCRAISRAQRDPVRLHVPPRQLQIGAAQRRKVVDSPLAGLEQAIEKLNIMREQEGRGMESELRRRLKVLEEATEEVSRHRVAVSQACMEKVRARMQELLGNVDQDRILQEAAILAERSDIQEELVRLHTHIDHFRTLLDQGGEIGKKLDFLLQELNREANTLLSKTSGVAGEGLRITELGLQMKSEIEKCREQVQNLE